MTSYLTENTECLYYQEQSLKSLYESNTENANTLCRQNIYIFFFVKPGSIFLSNFYILECLCIGGSKVLRSLGKKLPINTL